MVVMTRLQEIRERLGLTQEQMAEGIGCSQGNVWQIEQNGQRLLPERAEKVIDFCAQNGLPLTLDQVYGRAPLPPQPKKATA